MPVKDHLLFKGFGLCLMDGLVDVAGPRILGFDLEKLVLGSDAKWVARRDPDESDLIEHVDGIGMIWL